VSYLTQKTIKNKISFKGIGLHSGVNVNVSIKPANPNFGIVFKRVDLKNNNLVYPNFANVSNTSLNTTIENEFGAKVSTIEHLMGALFGLSIDNALIEIDNEEVPILDGSAKEFINKILSSGIEVSDVPIKVIKINKKIEYKGR
jgi:UDP-3-O-[3-hydroxymyristoyl] N-acetylglucosamine deacetylase